MTWQEAVNKYESIQKWVKRPSRRYFEDNGYDEDQYREALRYYRETHNDAVGVIKISMLDDVGLSRHPKAEQAWKMAWDRGHSSGWHEVYQELCELAELADLLLG